MTSQTLVLNADYKPICVVPLQRAVVMMYLEAADLVETDGSYLHSQHLMVETPTVVRLREYVRLPFKRRVPVTRRSVLARDNHVCGYCGGKADTVDHIIPKAQGGLHTWKNVAAACKACNGRKGARTPDEAGMPLSTKPFEPVDEGALTVVIRTMDETWEAYLAYA